MIEYPKEPCDTPFCSCQYDHSRKGFICSAPHLIKTGMERSEVYKALDSERDYQDRMTARKDRQDMIEDFRLSDGLLVIRQNLEKAEAAWYKGCTPYNEAMDHLRKIAGTVVKLAERYGIPQRPSQPEL